MYIDTYIYVRIWPQGFWAVPQSSLHRNRSFQRAIGVMQEFYTGMSGFKVGKCRNVKGYIEPHGRRYGVWLGIPGI